MSQLNLFPTEEQSIPKVGLLLAVFPEEHAAHSIYKLQANLRCKHGLCETLRPPNHLHISVPCLGNARGSLTQVIQSVAIACQAATETTPPFEVTFERVLSFKGKPMEQALVLLGRKDENTELRALHRRLVAELSDRTDVNPKFTPHITLLYGREIHEEPINPAISWRVSEIVLVLSHRGATKYDRLGCWKLGTSNNFSNAILPPRDLSQLV